MESEVGALLFSEPSCTTMNSMTQMPGTISSWLNLDDIYIPTFLNELPADYTIPDDRFFDFPPSNDQNSPFSLHPQLNYSTNESFLFDDLETDTDMFQPAKPETYTSTWSTITTAGTPIERSESNQSMDCDAWLAEPEESIESYGEPFLGSSADTPLPEMGVQPALSWTNSAENGSGNDENGEEEEEETDDEKKTIVSSSKNLMSERNRRKRLSRQLLALRALVPNITKMDKRSVLVDALAYLSSIHEKIADLKKVADLKKGLEPKPSTQTEIPLPPQPTLASQTEKPKPKPKPRTQILEIDAEKIEDQRFVVKITCNGGAGAGGEVLRVIESLGFEITYTSLDKIKPMLVLLTIFLRVRKQGKMTEEKLKDCITSKALIRGLLLKNP